MRSQGRAEWKRRQGGAGAEAGAAWGEMTQLSAAPEEDTLAVGGGASLQITAGSENHVPQTCGLSQRKRCSRRVSLVREPHLHSETSLTGPQRPCAGLPVSSCPIRAQGKRRRVTRGSAFRVTAPGRRSHLLGKLFRAGRAPDSTKTTQPRSLA